MSEVKSKQHEAPFFVRMKGDSFADDKSKGALSGYTEKSEADANCNDRNKRATDAGLKARYEVVEN